MGNDGGSIPTRRELVKEAARNPTIAELKESQNEQQEYQWSTDPISRQPLAQPVVSDSSGKLYNKDTILEYLVEGARKEDAERETKGAVKSLKDVVEVKFELDSDASGPNKKQAWKCPVTGDRLGPGSKAAYIVPCGHAFSGSAIKEVSGEKCLTCDTEYASNDIIPINSVVDTDIARLVLRAKALQEKGLTHSLKKAPGSKKRKKRDEQAADTNTNGTAEENGASSKGATPKASTPNEDGNSRINNSATASLTAKVMQHQEQSKKRKTENDNVKSLFSNRDQAASLGNSAGFMTRGFSHKK
ncbi:hypothetical protein Q7P37_005339 [Cladosporium fusiforme]